MSKWTSSLFFAMQTYTVFYHTFGSHPLGSNTMAIVDSQIGTSVLQNDINALLLIEEALLPLTNSSAVPLCKNIPPNRYPRERKENPQCLESYPR